MNKKLLDKIIDWNYGEFGKEFGDTLVDLKNENERLNNIIDTLKIEISSLMGRYFYEKEFCIEDTDLDKLLRIIDGDIEINKLKGDNK